MESWAGRVLSKVRIERLIGRGGMADVYLGWHTTLNRPMAVKLLHPHMTGDAEVRRRFRDEAQAVAALRHPNIVQVNDFDVAEDRPYIVMELLEGMSLADYLRGLHGAGQSLPLKTVLRIMDLLTGALDYAHGRGIVHRDVKPANIILRADDSQIRPPEPLGPDVEPVLTDFGVARIASSTTPTASGTILGTPAYMSPEQARGDPVDSRSDIYSVGIILYEILEGRPPFDPETDTPASILFKQVNTDPPPLKNVPLAIQQVAMTALAKNMDARYQKAGQLSRDLRAAIEAMPEEATSRPRPTQHGVQAPAPASTPRFRLAQVPWTHPLIILAGLALAVLVLVGGAALGGQLVPITPEMGSAPIATTEAAAASSDRATPTAQQGSGTEEVPATATNQGPVQEGPAGMARVQDSTLTVRLLNVEAAPEGESYHAWLLADQPSQAVNLNRDGSVDWAGHQLLISYTQPESVHLFEAYRQFVVSLEPRGSLLAEPSRVVYRGEIGEQTSSLVRLVAEEHPGDPLSANLPDYIALQANHFSSHAGFALDGLEEGDFGAVKLHTEHVINILDGREGELYGDWNGDDSAENPGDEVGLLALLEVLEESAAGAARVDQERGGTGEPAASISQRAGDLADQIRGVRETARQIALADEVSAIQDFGLDDELQAGLSLKDQIDRLAEDARALDLVFVFDIIRAP